MYVRELTVLPSDASCRGELKLHGLLDCLQDTAGMAVDSGDNRVTIVELRFKVMDLIAMIIGIFAVISVVEPNRA